MKFLDPPSPCVHNFPIPLSWSVHFGQIHLPLNGRHFHGQSISGKMAGLKKMAGFNKKKRKPSSPEGCQNEHAEVHIIKMGDIQLQCSV